MKSWMTGIGVVALAICVAGTAGCDFIGQIISPQTTRVELVNAGSYPVEVELWYGDEQDVPRDILTALGEEINRTIDPGDTYRFSRDCDDLQAVVIEDADLRIIGGIGPEEDTDVIRDGEEFGCGDTITFTFRHDGDVVPSNFRIDVDIDPYQIVLP